MYRRLASIFLILLIALFLVPYAGAQTTTSWQVGDQHVILDIDSSGTVSMQYMINATIQQGVWTEVWVPVSDSSQQVQSVTANGQQHSFDMGTYSNGVTNVMIEGFNLNPGDHVSLTINSTLSNFVYQSDQPGYDIVTFAPVYWDMPITDTQVKFYLPGNISKDQVFTGTGLPQYDNFGVENDRTWVYFQNTNLAPDEQFQVAVSFPDTYMASGAAVAGNTGGSGFGGSGQTIDVGGVFDTLLSLACPGIIVLIVIIGLIGSIGSYNRKPYSSPVVSMDGIGVNKGLDPVEAATLLRVDPKRVLTMIMFGMMKKGNVKLLSTEPVKLQLVSSQGVNYYEKLFADAIVDDKLNEDKLLDCFKVLARRVVDKTRPYSRKDTEDYYRSKIDESWEQIKAVDTPELKLEKYDTNMFWLMADDQFTKKTTDYVANAPGSSTFNVPTYYWWYPYYFGLPRYYGTGYGGVPQQPSGMPPQAGTAKAPAPTNQTTTSVESFAKSITHSVESTSAGVVGSVDGFLGVRNQANAPPPKPAFTPSSGGGGRSSCACVSCACACAHCACACACAGGGHGCT